MTSRSDSGYRRLARLAMFRPLSTWPGARTDDPQPSRFTAGWSDTVGRLAIELEHLDAERVVVELDGLTEADLRLDGLPRAGARPGRGVVVSFDSKHGPLRYACDQFEPGGYRAGGPAWQHNLRAIALGLEALRKVDRYGIATTGEQYAGWKALPAPSSDASTHLTRSQAIRLLGELIDSPDEWVEAYTSTAIRRARAAAHPDRHDNDRDLWDRVEAATKVLT